MKTSERRRKVEGLSQAVFTVLLVDDNEVVRETCMSYLEAQDFCVVAAEDGHQALEWIEKLQVDLVLLDVMMPGLSGFEVLTKLRQGHSPQQLPVIMATAKDQNQDVVKAFELGASDYITKPLDLPVLLVRIRAQLRSRMAQAEQAPQRQMPDATIEPGAVLDGKYRLETLIGQGNYGLVYGATQLALERPVAVKLLERDVAMDMSVERFQQEGISACRVDHPNAVSVLDSSMTSVGVPYLVMELLEGHSLEHEMRRRGRLDPQRCAEILFPICEVLGVAHAAGIIHRDIKPQNIFLHQSRHGEVLKVLDFGIAKLAGETAVGKDLTPDDSVMGTPIYMAPERFVGEDYSGFTDVYSLGVVLYEMLAGQLPFGDPEQNPVRMILKHVNDTPEPLAKLCPELPPAVGKIVHQALEKDPWARPTARQLARGFAQALEIAVPSSLVKTLPETA